MTKADTRHQGRGGSVVRAVTEVGGGLETVPGMVSVIVTCFNGERWIRRAMESALSQTYENREIIVVDDASTDGSLEILEEYRGLPRVELLLQQENRGIPATKNAGIQLASGEYVAFLEQDDEWHREKLTRQVEVLEGDPEVGLVYTIAVYVDSQGRECLIRKAARVPPSSRQAAVEAIFRRNPVPSMSCVAMRRRCLDELHAFDERFYGADDYDLWLRAAGHYKIGFVDQPLVRFHRHGQSYSSSRADFMLRDRLVIIESAVVRYPFLAPLKRKRLARVWLSSAVQAFEQGTGREAFRYAFQALRLVPASPRIYAVLAMFLTGGAGRRWLALWRRVTRFRVSGPDRGLDRGEKRVPAR